MTPRTLTGRLTVAAILAVVRRGRVPGVSAQLLVAHQLRSSLDDEPAKPRRRRRPAERVGARSARRRRARSRRPSAGASSRVEVLDRRGRFVARSLTLGAKLLPASAVRAARPAARAQRVRRRGARRRAAAALRRAAPRGRRPGRGRGGARRGQHERHRGTRCTAWPGCCCSAARWPPPSAGGRGPPDPARLRPLGRLSTAAKEIERTGDPALRLPDPRGRGRGRRPRPHAQRRCSPRSTPRAGASGASSPTPATSSAPRSPRWPATSTSSPGTALNPEVLADLLARHRAAAAAGRRPARARARGRVGGTGRARCGSTRSSRARPPSTRPSASGPRAPATVAGEADALRRALENLLENAQVHGDGRGRGLAARSRTRRAVLAVTDEGAGFAPGDVDHAFERFWRGPGARGSAGLGARAGDRPRDRRAARRDRHRERRDRADRHPGGGRAERRGDLARVAADGTIGTHGPQVSAARSDLPADAVNTRKTARPPRSHHEVLDVSHLQLGDRHLRARARAWCPQEVGLG